MNVFKVKLNNILEKYKKGNIAIKASIWFTLCSIFQRGISVITMPIFTRLMSISEFGEYNIFQTWYNILIIIITLNVQSEIFNKGLIEHIEEKDKYTTNQMGLLIVLSSFFFLIYIVFYNIINHFMRLTIILIVIMFLEILCNAIISIWLTRKRFDFEYKKIVILTMFMAILNPVLGILMVSVSTAKAEARIISNAIVPFCIAIILLIIYRKKGKLFDEYHWWKTSVKISIPLIPHYLSLVLLNQSDKLMINSFIGSEKTAIYSVAHSAGLLMTIINTSINNTFVPYIYKKIKNNDFEGVKLITSLISLIIAIVNVFLIWFAPEAIKLLAPSQYYEAIWCLVPIAVSVYCFFIYTLFVDIEIYYGANSFVAIASICAALANIVLNFIFIPKYGYIVAGYTTLVSYFLTMVLHYIFMRRVIKHKKSDGKLFNEKIIIIIFLGLIIMSIIAMLLYNQFIIRYLIVFIIIYILIKKYHSFIFILKELKKEGIK